MMKIKVHFDNDPAVFTLDSKAYGSRHTNIDNYTYVSVETNIMVLDVRKKQKGTFVD